LSRDAAAVARSFRAIGCIPERTEAGRLVCVGPTDPGVLPVADWTSMSDYQLCYWYALEMERRQHAYRELFARAAIPYHEIAMADLLDLDRFSELAHFIGGRGSLDPAAFHAIVAVNQNPRSNFGVDLRATPDAAVLDAEERDVRERVQRAAAPTKAA
jgi:hypothetical protein